VEAQKNGSRGMRRFSTIHYSSLFVSARNEYGLKKSLMDIVAFGACGVRILLAGNVFVLRLKAADVKNAFRSQHDGLGCGAGDMKASAAILEPRLLRG